VGSVLGAVLLAATMAACGSTNSAGSDGGSSKTPILIGASLSLSGDFSADGQAYQKGYTLWAKYVNSHGGLLGRQVKLDIISDNSDPTQVDTNYQKLITIDHVALILGPFSTLLTVPSSKIAHRYGYAMVEGAGGGPLAFAQGLDNVFDVSAPVANALVPFANWIVSMPASTRPKTAAFPTSNDPFTQPQIVIAQHILQAAGIRTVYSKVFPAEVTDYTPIADAVASSGAQVVFLGSVDVPTVSAFIQAFTQQHYNPEAFIAAAGPDQGSAFLSAVGAANANGMMVPNTWYPGVKNAASEAMVKDYISAYGGNASGVNADVAEAWSVGQVLDQAVTHLQSLDNSKIIAYLHSGVTFTSVQGPVKFNSLGENVAATIYGFQWVNSVFQQVLPKGDPNTTVAPLYPKPNWAA
jgi:branched-chain amino acid transport system substrate-binding protein